jgi:hypothetical protein
MLETQYSITEGLEMLETQYSITEGDFPSLIEFPVSLIQFVIKDAQNSKLNYRS